jgi:hypothetical protein
LAAAIAATAQELFPNSCAAGRIREFVFDGEQVAPGKSGPRAVPL